MPGTPSSTRKAFASTILLWVLDTVPRQRSMDRWKGPHSKIITASPGHEEYRQLHHAENSPGLWPVTPGVETAIPTDRKVDGVAEVTFRSVVATLGGRSQTKEAYADEIHNFRRTLLHAGPPYRRYLKAELVPAIARDAALTELRTQPFMKWNQALWNTPDVAHDNPADQQFHASVILGFADAGKRDRFLQGAVTGALGPALATHASAVHAYDMTAYRYKRDGVLLPEIEE